MRNKGTDLGHELYSGPLTEDSSPWPWPMSPWRTLSQTSCHRQLRPCWKFRFSVEKFPHSGGVTKYVQMHWRRQQKQFYFTHINCPSWRFNSEPEESFLAQGFSQRGGRGVSTQLTTWDISKEALSYPTLSQVLSFKTGRIKIHWERSIWDSQKALKGYRSC